MATTLRTLQIGYKIGHAKYLVSFHDGVQKHRDGSPFFAGKIFKNKRKMEKFVKELKAQGYKEE